MRKRFAWIVIALAALLLPGAACLAALQDEGSQPEQQPAAPAAEPAKGKAVKEQPVEIAGLFTPALADALTEQFGPVKRGQPGFAGPDNLTILTVPPGGTVFVAAVIEIKAATTPDGNPATIEDVVFSNAHQVGLAPLTVTLAPGDYVVAVRCPARYSGFDGDCVRKTTADIVTGGKRHCYHLYAVRKQAGEYMCFPANFYDENNLQESTVSAQARAGTYRFAEDQLVQLLADATGVPEEDRQSVAKRLNQLGAAFYGGPGSRYLVKLTIQGSAPLVKEWLVTE